MKKQKQKLLKRENKRLKRQLNDCELMLDTPESTVGMLQTKIVNVQTAIK